MRLRARAQETVFASQGGEGDLFASGHLDTRVPLAAVTRRVAVALCPPGAPPPPPGAGLRCRFFFDHAADGLAPLAPGMLPG